MPPKAKPSAVKEWYEVLLSVHDNWSPTMYDILEHNFEPADLVIPAHEFDQKASVIDVLTHFMTSGLSGMSRPLRLFDILHFCRNAQYLDGSVKFGTLSYLIAPRERHAEFAQLCATGRAPFADQRMPELCIVPLAKPFPRSFKRRVQQA